VLVDEVGDQLGDAAWRLEHGDVAEALEAEAESDPDTALQRVAWVYKVPERHVHAATRFEQWLRAA